MQRIHIFSSIFHKILTFFANTKLLIKFSTLYLTSGTFLENRKKWFFKNCISMFKRAGTNLIPPIDVM